TMRSCPNRPRLPPPCGGKRGRFALWGLADRQWGVVSRGQLSRCGLSDGAIDRWLANGRLRRIHPGVYALGHRALRQEAQLTAALLHAGPGAALSHASAAWWWQLSPSAPVVVQVSAPGDRRSIRGVRI